MSQNLPDNYQEDVPEYVDMCQDEWEQLGYHAQYHHIERDLEKKNENRRKRIQKKKYWISRIKEEFGCAVCSEDVRVCLVYHHIEGNKEFYLSQAPYRDIGKERLKEELNKCVVLCANCHRKEHAGVIDIDQKI